MHHLGLSRSPFQSRQPSSITPSSTFTFSSPALSQAFSSPSYAPLALRSAVVQEASSLDTASQDEVSVGVADQNGRDVLLEQLRDLIEALEDEENGFEDGALVPLQGEMNKLERLLAVGVDRREASRVESDEGEIRERMTLEEIRRSEEDSYLVEVSPTAMRKVRKKVEMQRRRKQNRIEQDELDSDFGSRSSRWGQESHVSVESTSQKDDSNDEPRMTVQQATAISQAAQELSAQLLATVTELQARKTESDEIHDLLIQRCEASTERILILEYRIAEMEDDSAANASELTFLRLQLQAVEAQCAPYMGQEGDEELSASLGNWKIDWEEVNRRSRARRKEKDVLVPSSMVVRDASAEVPLRRSYSHSERSVSVDSEDG